MKKSPFKYDNRAANYKLLRCVKKMRLTTMWLTLMSFLNYTLQQKYICYGAGNLYEASAYIAPFLCVKIMWLTVN